MSAEAVHYTYWLGAAVCLLGGTCIVAGAALLAIHLVWKLASNVYGIAWLWNAIAAHKEEHPIPQWTGMGELRATKAEGADQ